MEPVTGPRMRAKFRCVRVSLEEGWGTRKDGTSGQMPMKTVRLVPVMNASEENKAFFAATPSGSIELGILNPSAAEWFEVGKEYYIDFTPAV